MNKLKSLIIGYGSIGKRHAQLQKEFNVEVSLVSKQNISDFDTYVNISDAFKHFKPDFVLIANETSKHLQSLIELKNLGFKGRILCEKPIHSSNFNKTELIEINDNILVTYNLRFHPLIQKLKEKLGPNKILSFNCYVGQYLPDWRPGTDYSKSYSAKINLGGGVLRDLSHEIDYSLYLFGSPTSVKVFTSKVSDLNIETEDIAMIYWQTKTGGMGSITLNYLDRKVSRFLIVNTSEHTFKIDFTNSELWINDQVEKINTDRNTTYKNMYASFFSNDYSTFCTLEDALMTMKIIESADSPPSHC